MERLVGARRDVVHQLHHRAPFVARRAGAVTEHDDVGGDIAAHGVLGRGRRRCARHERRRVALVAVGEHADGDAGAVEAGGGPRIVAALGGVALADDRALRRADLREDRLGEGERRQRGEVAERADRYARDTSGPSALTSVAPSARSAAGSAEASAAYRFTATRPPRTFTMGLRDSNVPWLGDRRTRRTDWRATARASRAARS